MRIGSSNSGRTHTDEAAGRAGRNCADLRVPSGAFLLQLHHRRGAAHHRWLFRRRVRSRGDVIALFEEAHKRALDAAQTFTHAAAQ